MTKNREETEKKIINSVGQVLIEEGANTLGINSIARRAGVSKVLIYRYFGSYDELILKYIKMNNPFPYLKEKTINYIDDGNISYQEVFSFFFEALIDYIGENPAFREILTFELVSSNRITKEIAIQREESAMDILNFVKENYPEINFDIPSITSLITGGIFYLCQRSKFVGEFNSMDMENYTQSLKIAVKNLINLL